MEFFKFIIDYQHKPLMGDIHKIANMLEKNQSGNVHENTVR